MVSKQSQPLIDYYRRVNASLHAQTPLDEHRVLMDHWGDHTKEPGGVDYIEVEAGGRPSLWVVPKESAEDRVLLCLHGGGFITGSIYTHRKLFAHLAKAVGARALVASYRRTPEFRHPAPVDDTTAVYRWLLDEGISPHHIALTGDSAGGGLVVTTMVRALRQGLPLAAALMPFSPWFDMETQDGTRTTNIPTDVIFGGDTPADLKGLADMFLGESGDPTANALYGDLTGFPPIYIQVSNAEMVKDDSDRLAARAEEHGVDVKVDVFPDQVHTWHRQRRPI